MSLDDTRAPVKHKRLLLYSALYVLIFVLGLGPTYWLMFSITGSKTIAIYILAFSVLLIAPLFFVSLYWSFRSEFRAFMITTEESMSIAQSSMLIAISSIFLIGGALIFQDGWLFVGAVLLMIYVFLTGLSVRFLWRSKRQAYEKLIGDRMPNASPTSLNRPQRRNLLPVIVLSTVIQVFGWSGIYLIFQGSVFIGVSAITIAALLCSPLVRKVRGTVVADANTT